MNTVESVNVKPYQSWENPDLGIYITSPFGKVVCERVSPEFCLIAENAPKLMQFVASLVVSGSLSEQDRQQAESILDEMSYHDE